MGISNVLTLLSGVALFLFGMSLMGDGLKNVAGNQLETFLYKLTNTPLKGVLLGTIVTAIIQSSSATSVMVVGFVNSGMMQVSQAIGIIMGANIGTSITGWILCLSYIDGSSGIAQILSTSTISALMAIIGILFRTLSKKQSHVHVGTIMLGFAILMFGMQSMSGAVSPLKENEDFVNLLTMFENPFIGILVGIAFTAVLQSASASVGILQALSVTGTMTFASALPIIMGIGVGAACPVLLSSIGTNKNGKRTALIYLLNDLFGMVFWSIVFYSVNSFVHFEFMSDIMTPVAIAFINTLFRTATILVLLPFVKFEEKLVFWLVKDEVEEEDEDDKADFSLLEERFLSYPALAIRNSHQTVVNMAYLARKNVIRAMNLMIEFSDKKYNKVNTKEDYVDKYEDKLGNYLMKLTVKEMNNVQTRKVAEYLHVISDFERLGDRAADIADVGKELYEKKIEFSDDAKKELCILLAATREIMQLTVDAFKNDDVELSGKVEPLHEVVDALCEEFKLRHTIRLQNGVCELSHGFPFNETLNACERIASQCSHVAVAVIEANEIETEYAAHGKLQEMRSRKDENYKNLVKEYTDKYTVGNIEVLDDMVMVN
ncbi:MAG: Na/Pi cotransporter family protein [Eubacterium sp.]|nr:Na/Pi cotransporter family protein [Eubacterium sp.]